MSFLSRLKEKFAKKIIRKEIRIIGIDDSPFSKTKKGDVLVIGTIFRGGKLMDGLVSTYVQVDGSDATEKLIKLINETKHKGQLQVIMTDGIALGGFNVLDINTLSEKTSLPVIVVMRNQPDMERVFKALTHVPNYYYKEQLIKKAGEIHEVDMRKKGKMYIQVAGIRPEEARKIVKLSATTGLMPEPIRLAHIIGSGVVEGESRGRA
jgi:hypothetical protein